MHTVPPQQPTQQTPGMDCERCSHLAGLNLTISEILYVILSLLSVSFVTWLLQGTMCYTHLTQYKCTK